MLFILLPRLTGLYAIVIGLHATLVKFFATGVQVTEMLLPLIDQILIPELPHNDASGVLPN